MTADEADAVLLQMSNIWWSSKIPSASLEMWHSFLQEREPQLCMDTLADLAVVSGRWPNMNEFYLVYKQKKQYLANSAQHMDQLDMANSLPKEENVRRIQELRGTLKSVGE